MPHDQPQTALTMLHYWLYGEFQGVPGAADQGLTHGDAVQAATPASSSPEARCVVRAFGVTVFSDAPCSALNSNETTTALLSSCCAA